VGNCIVIVNSYFKSAVIFGMNNALAMDAHFERTKNLKAGGYTLLISGVIFMLLFVLGWQIPQIQPPVVDEGIEVNLGNSDQGLGDIAPSIPGEPIAAVEDNLNPPPSQSQPEAEDNTKVDETDAIDATPVKINSKPVEKPKTKPSEAVVKNTTPNTVTNPTPKPPSPKAVYKGGTNPNATGGNRGDSYNNVKNQGIAGGNGDQGKPNGNPNSDSYTGNGGTGKSGVSIRSGLTGRRFTAYPSFTDDFNENAKVAVDIKVNADGKVLSAVVNPRGTTTTNAGIRSIAVRKALQLKLNSSSDEESSGTIVFDFKLRG
jgi:outer membrane biosynthesis protein TonB